MDYTNFCFWLNGFTEIQNPQTIPSGQLQEIKNHLDLVLKNNYTFSPYIGITGRSPYFISGNLPSFPSEKRNRLC